MDEEESSKNTSLTAVGNQSHLQRNTIRPRVRSQDGASNPPSDPPQTPPASDNQSLTSFPSLDPSLDNSPDVTRSPPAPLSPTSSAPPATATPRRPLHGPLDSLFNASGAEQGRSALFDDTPKVTRNIPGTLHLQDDKHVRHLVSRVGGVPLVKQLAADLAQRDAQVTLLQRRAEGRERLLKKMLRECEISNANIEARLRELDADKAADNGAESSSVSSKRNSDLRSIGTRPDAGLDDRMSEALSDELGSENAVMVGSIRSETSLGHLGQDTVRRASSQIRRNDPGHTSKKSSWTDVFKYRPGNAVETSRPTGNLSRGTTNDGNAQLSRKSSGLSSDMFRPPAHRSVSDHGSSPDLDSDDSPRRNTTAGMETQSVKFNSSAASWAMKLVGGSSQPKSRGSLAPSKIQASNDAQAALSRVRAGLKPNVDSQTQSVHRHSTSSLTGPTGTIKRSSPETIRKDTSSILHPSSPPRSLGSASSNLGPVEMDSILPEDGLPPTLLQQYRNAETSEFLTDNFGFIYDQRRRRRQREAAKSLRKAQNGPVRESLEDVGRTRIRNTSDVDDDELSIHSHLSLALSDPRPDTPVSMNEPTESQQPKRWQDYLKLSNFPTELLSHTPSVAPITSITTAKQRDESLTESMTLQPSLITVSKQGSAPSLSIHPPATTTAVSDDAQATRSATSDISTSAALPPPEVDPVKSLLDQLTEVHNASQRERTLKWNEFMRKVRAQRKRRVDTTNNTNETRVKANFMPEVTMLDGEFIGIAGLGSSGKVGREKYRELRSLVLSGIPVSYRPKLWSEGTGASTLRVPGYYDELRRDAHLVDESVAQQIDMDITRTLTDNIFFRQGPGVSKLREILLAYAHRDPDIGYCQGMNLITANLLLIMPTAEDAFWVLASMIENILPGKYYDSSLLTSRADQVVLRRYVAELLPTLSTHLENLGIELEAQTFQWFLSVFTDCLSAEALFRVWDVVLCLPDGAVFLFQVALALLKLNEKQLLACDNPASVYEYVNQRMTDHAISIDGLIRASEGLKNVVKPDEVRRRRSDAVAREEETLRQRESIRKGKMKAVDVIADDSQGGPGGTRRGAASKVVEELERGKEGKLKRGVSKELLEAERLDQFDKDTEVRTPLPVDEEALWRA